MKNVFFSIVSVIAVVIAVAGVVTLAIGLRRLLRGLASRGWPKARATITASRVVEEQVASADDDRPPGTVFRAAVEYEFEVASTRYTGDRISFDSVDTSDRARAERTVAGYRVGAQVDASYDPTNPAESVLLPGISTGSVIIPAAGALALAVAAGMWTIVRFLAGR